MCQRSELPTVRALPTAEWHPRGITAVDRPSGIAIGVASFVFVNTGHEL
jgi:hypothetical protein